MSTKNELEVVQTEIDHFLVPSSTRDASKNYFCVDYDTEGEYTLALPAVVPKDIRIFEALAHEYVHGNTSLAVGVKAVKYSIGAIMDYSFHNQAHWIAETANRQFEAYQQVRAPHFLCFQQFS
jgi:hypothetical protein